MRYRLIILFTLISSCVFAQDRWAIIVGISNYPEQSGWSKINGANDVDIIVPMLLRNGFSNGNIQILTDCQATKKNIKDSISLLEGQLDLGDVVYIHFSGHGQLITDLDRDENDGYDESFIPFDAQKVYNKNVYTGENHIVDDELNEWLHNIKSKIGPNGKIVVILDACHSGGGSRGELDEDVVIRGVRDRFIIPSPSSEPVSKSRNIDWLCVSACKSSQENEEYKGYGRLSYALNIILQSTLTIGQLKEELMLLYSNIPRHNILPQEPDIEYTGNENEYVL